MNTITSLREKLQPIETYFQLQKEYDILTSRKQEYKDNVRPAVIKDINKRLLANKKRMLEYRKDAHKNIPAIKVLLDMHEYETRPRKLWKKTEVIIAYSLLALVIFVYVYAIVKIF